MSGGALEGRLALLAQLKQLIVVEAQKSVDPRTIGDDDVLFGPASSLALDSLDALQISIALQKRFGVRLTDSKETRRILSSVGNLADFLISRTAG